jgi:hypothetical protein
MAFLNLISLLSSAALLLLLCQQQRLLVVAFTTPAPECGAEMQVIMCSDIPWGDVRDRRSCCHLYRPMPASSSGVAPSTVTVPPLFYQSIPRYDLTPEAGALPQAINWQFGNCTEAQQVDLPTFSGPRSAAVITQQQVPKLRNSLIQAIKRNALSTLQQPLKDALAGFTVVNVSSGFVHPGTYAGPAELALMQHRLKAEDKPLTAARYSLLTGDEHKQNYLQAISMAICVEDVSGMTVEKDRVTLSCAPRLSRSVLSLLQLMHKENVS